MSKHGFGRWDIGAQKLGNTRNVDVRSDEENAATRAVLRRTTNDVQASNRLTKSEAYQVLDILGLLPEGTS